MIGTKGMKRQVTFLMGLILISSLRAASYYQNHEQGWHWYEPQETSTQEELQQPTEKTVNPSKVPPKKKTPKEIVANYREELENRLAAAWMDPTPQKIRAYQNMQKDLTDRSKAFSEGWMQNVFLNPTLDHTLVSLVNQRARHVHLDLEKKQVKETIQSLAKEYGLFFWHRRLNFQL